MNKNKALFLDRDGVVTNIHIRNGKAYSPTSFSDFKILDNVKEALIQSKKMGFLNIIVTNQPDVANKKISLGTLNKMHSFLREKLFIDDIFTCLHSDFDKCNCRKPLPGMLIEARNKWKIDFSKSYLVGDRWRDIGAAQAVGCKSFFIDHNYSEERPHLPYYKANSLEDAVKKIDDPFGKGDLVVCREHKLNVLLT